MISDEKLNALAEKSQRPSASWRDSAETKRREQALVDAYKSGYRQAEADSAELVQALDINNQFNNHLRARISLKEPYYTNSSIAKSMAEKALTKWRERGV